MQCPHLLGSTLHPQVHIREGPHAHRDRDVLGLGRAQLGSVAARAGDGLGEGVVVVVEEGEWREDGFRG